jgi:hypothetical protein
MKTFFIKPDPLVEGSENFNETFQNYVGGVSMVFTGGASVSLNLGSKGMSFLKSSVGKAVFETLAQVLVKGDIKNVDITDVAATALIKNQKARDVIKSFLDVSASEGFKLKDLNEGLTEFGLRIMIDKANPVKGDEGQKYVIDVIKKVELKEAKESLNEEE